MSQTRHPEPRFLPVEADPMYSAGAASPSEHGASSVVLCPTDITLAEAITSQKVIVETESHLSK